MFDAFEGSPNRFWEANAALRACHSGWIGFRRGQQHADSSHRPGGRRANERNELAPLHSITSSARTSSVSGTSMPSVFAVQAMAPSLKVEVYPINVRDAPEVERAVAAFARSSNGDRRQAATAVKTWRSRRPSYIYDFFLR
jgi:hypothetical protein